MNKCKKCKKFSTSTYCSNKCNPNSKDEYSPFKKHLKAARIRSRKKKIKCTVTVEDLKYIWEKQLGICKYTGWLMVNYGDKKRVGSREKYASLDRIDSSKGYIPGNIQFVSYMAQIAKGDFPENIFLTFCESVSYVKNNDSRTII